MTTLEIISTGAAPVSALAIGSVMDVIAGRIDPSLRTRRFRAADYFCGFESASPRELSSIGESVVINGVCYAASTEVGSADYGKLIWGDAFVTGGMFFLPKGALPTGQLMFNSSMKFEQLCQKIYHSVRRPVVFVGTWASETLYTMKIGKPPIDGLPIFENRDYYFPEPHQTLRGKHCFVMGIIADYGDERWKLLHKQLEVALYKNPYDQNHALSSHTHCLVLKSEVPIEKISPQTVEQCLHVFTDQTTLHKGRLNLYTLEQVISKNP